MNRLVPIAVPFALTLTSAGALADEAKPGSHLHDGFYLSLAAGVGFVRSNATTTANDLHDAGGGAQSSRVEATLEGFTFAGHVLAGWSLVPGLVLGGGHEGNLLPSAKRTGNGSSADLKTYTFGVTGPFVDWYLSPRGGVHFLAMAGLSDVIESAGGTSHGLLGFGGALGAGYDFFATDNWSVGVLGRGMLGEVSSTASGFGTSPANPNISGTGIHESQVSYGGALLLTTTYQ